MSYIVTGGCGFIGSNFVNYLCRNTDDQVIVIDSLTYAGRVEHIQQEYMETCSGTGEEPIWGRVRLFQDDISQPGVLDKLLQHNKIKGIFHFAAESHVDNSITGPRQFVETNVVGTFNLLESVRAHAPDIRFLHVSTDEVYGALLEDGPSFLESKVLEPNNVYSATKASSDLLVRSFHKTYGLDVVTTRCCNNYGPRQDTEKLLPKVISNALNDITIPVYGKGDNVREWIFVEDHCRAILEVFDKGESNEIYNIGSGIEVTNLDLVKKVLSTINKPYNLIKFVADRPGHDFRYSIDNSKFLQLVDEFSFTELNTGLEKTIEWYRESSQGK